MPGFDLSIDRLDDSGIETDTSGDQLLGGDRCLEDASLECQTEGGFDVVLTACDPVRNRVIQQLFAGSQVQGVIA